MLSLLYLWALGAVLTVIVALTWSAVTAVSRKPEWAQAPKRSAPLELVVTEERRVQSLPYVGVDRRTSTGVRQAKNETAQLMAG